VGRDAGTLSETHAKKDQKIHAKSTNIAELNTALLSIWNDLPQEFIDKEILSF